MSDSTSRVEKNDFCAGVAHPSAALIAARNRFFPGWFDYLGLTVEFPVRPIYRVECSSEEDFRLATDAKPEFVRAEIIRAW